MAYLKLHFHTDAFQFYLFLTGKDAFANHLHHGTTGLNYSGDDFGIVEDDYYVFGNELYVHTNGLYNHANKLYVHTNGLYHHTNDLYVHANGLYHHTNDLYLYTNGLYLHTSHYQDSKSQNHDNDRLNHANETIS